VLLRLAYLGVTNALAMLRLLPMTDRDKDAEIMALRHQIMILQRRLHGQRIRFTPRTGRCSPHCCTDSPAPCYARSGCWYAPRPSCAGRQLLPIVIKHRVAGRHGARDTGRSLLYAHRIPFRQKGCGA
jgi:hypothetical protein